MFVKKVIEPIYLGKESIIDILSVLLSNNVSYMRDLQSIAEGIADQAEVSNHE